jgi:hypothetical protein
VIYLAETNISLPLYDPHAQIARLKEQVAIYPPLLKQKTVAGALWMAEFSLIHADSFASTGNVYTTAGALARAASFMTQALFALKETYFISNKTALQEIVAFPLRPEGYAEKLSAVLGQTGLTVMELQQAARDLRALWAEVVNLTAGAYRPAFRVDSSK